MQSLDGPVADKSGPKRSFQCNWPGCTNTYARSEHLNRHRLNHEPVKIYQCEICPKTFVRSDLLFRHKDRHAKRANKRSPNSAHLKPIRPARSDSASSREEAMAPYRLEPINSVGQAHESALCSSYSSSVDGGLTRSLSRPRSLLQSPFSSSSHVYGSPNQVAIPDLQGVIHTNRNNTLPLLNLSACSDRPGPMNSYNPVYGFDREQDFVSSSMPPIRNAEVPKSRTYSIESMLNKPASFSGLHLPEPVI